MVIQNALNLVQSGIISHDGAGVFVGRIVTGTTDFIDVVDGDGISGNPVLSIATNFESTGMHSWNGATLETTSILVTSDGATITFSIEKSGGGDLTVVFSDGYYIWDTSPADTVTLTAGSDTSPQLNYVYFLQSTKTLTSSTSGWPTTEYAPLATVLCQSAASLQTDGAYKVHAWIDHVVEDNEMGHISDINLWIRQRDATWLNGVVQTYTIDSGPSPDDVFLTTSSGEVMQLHCHTFPAFSGTVDYYVVNDNATPYNKVTNLNTLLTDSAGGSLINRYFTLVIWGSVSETEADCKLYVNLPGGSYNNIQDLEDDRERYTNYSIPAEFLGTGFLISEWRLRHQAAGGGTWISIDEIDLRGLYPAVFAGSGSGISSVFVDNTFRVVDDGDITKEIALQASGITTGNIRTITMADQDVNLTPGITYEPEFNWNDVTGTSDTLVSNNGYIANNAGLVTLTLPVSSVIGDVFKVVVRGTGLCTIAQNASQSIQLGTNVTTVGVGGSLTATSVGDTLEIVCVASNVFFVQNFVGTWNVL